MRCVALRRLESHRKFLRRYHLIIVGPLCSVPVVVPFWADYELYGAGADPRVAQAVCVHRARRRRATGAVLRRSRAINRAQLHRRRHHRCGSRYVVAAGLSPCIPNRGSACIILVSIWLCIALHLQRNVLARHTRRGHENERRLRHASGGAWNDDVWFNVCACILESARDVVFVRGAAAAAAAPP